MARDWTIYEKNQLIKHGLADHDLTQYDEAPVEYITGWAPFLDDEFEVTPDVLIPRVETADLVELAEEIVLGKNKVRLADIGTGSGCIGITLMKRLEKNKVEVEAYLSDISEKALGVARKNAGRILGEKSNLLFLESDLFSGYPEIKFDLVIANLPYIPSSRLPTLDRSVIQFEPVIALGGGPDGLAVIKRFLQKLDKYLGDDGKAVLEIDESHLLDNFKEFTQYKLEIRTDQYGKNRFLLISQK